MHHGLKREGAYQNHKYLPAPASPCPRQVRILYSEERRAERRMRKHPGCQKSQDHWRTRGGRSSSWYKMVVGDDKLGKREKSNGEAR